MKKNKKTLIAAIPLFLIVILVFAGFGVWKKYRDTLMQNQEEQMLLTTRILSENMAMSTEEYEESLSFLAKTAENRPQDEAKQLYREFIDTQTSFITNLYLEDEQGKLSESVKDVQIVSSQLLTQSSAKNSIYMEKDTENDVINPKKKNIFWDLFITFFNIGAFTFVGGYALIPIIQEETVTKKKWISDEDILDVVAIAESPPGPISLNTSTYVGYRTAGVFGAFCVSLGVVLPSFGIIV